MIQDVEVKIAEDSEELFWTTLKKDAVKRIENMRHEIIINEAIIKLADEKLER